MTLGCARNEVDSEELAGRLAADGFRLVDDPADADTVVVNTCGFVEQAKKDSVDTLLEAADLKGDRPAPRPSSPSAAWPSGTARSWPSRCPRPTRCSASTTTPTSPRGCARSWRGSSPPAHTPQDRRRLLPISPVDRQATPRTIPGHAPASLRIAPRRRVRWRRSSWPPAATGAAPSARSRRFRGSFVSRRPTDVLDEARWLAADGVRELFLVSENSTSYGKDLGDLRLLETLLPELAAVDGVERVRVSYLQPAETRPGLLEAIATHARASRRTSTSPSSTPATPVLRRMRRFGDPESFLGLLERVRALAPEAGVRSNVIVGFPGETEDDLETLCDFLVAARLDVIGVFGYSDEDGTEAASYDDKLDEDEVRARAAHVADLVEELTAQRAEERIGEEVEVLVEDARRRRGRRAAPPTRAPRSTAPPTSGRRRRRGSATWSAPPWSRQRRRGPGGEPA